jgi:hypothetical protein
MLFLSWVTYGLFLLFIGSSDNYNSYGVIGVAFTSSKTYLLLFLVTGINFLIDLSTYSFYMIFMKKLTELLRILVKEKGIINEETQLSEEIIPFYEQYKFAINDGISNETKLKRKEKSNIKNIEKIDRINIVELESISSNRDDEDIKIENESKS